MGLGELLKPKEGTQSWEKDVVVVGIWEELEGKSRGKWIRKM